MLATRTTSITTPTSGNVSPKSALTSRNNGGAERYQNLSVIRKISGAKFPIYLVASEDLKQNYAMKTFSHSVEDYKAKFRNEVRFTSLNHPYLIKFVQCEQDKEVLHQGQLKTVSYILMEYAPNGDLFDFIMNYKAQIEEKLSRTYFRQLIDAIEYLHENGIAHLDLKPENILIGADYNLKICDFDLSYMYGDSQILSKGTKNYRAPEFFKSTSSSSSSSSSPRQSEISFAADIYSAGVILFLLKTEGFYPHTEEDNVTGINFFELMYKNNTKFWKYHKDIQGKGSSFFDSKFKDLFNGMTKINPKDRFTIRQIKKSKWYNGPVYTPMELKDKMKRLLNH